MLDTKNLVTYTTHDVAGLLSASRTSVQRWIDNGALKAFRTPGGHRRVTRAELVAFLRRQGAPVPPTLAARVRVLAVVEDAGVRKALEKALGALSDEVALTVVESAIDGLLRVGQGQADAVLIDRGVGDMDGGELARRLAQSPGRPLVFVMAGRVDEASAEKLEKSGVSAVLAKPPEAGAFRQALQDAALLDAREETS
ncbi:MAG: hypothetical protein AMXMBFR34_30100 [Myxococcaceae bacterium]